MIGMTGTSIKAAMFAGLVAIGGGAAIAQQGGVAVPPMPKEVESLGDKDAACALAGVETFARAKANIDKAPADQRDAVLELPQREVGFYVGRLSAQQGDAKAKTAMAQTTAAYFDKTKLSDSRPTMLWCLRSYLDLSDNVFNTRMKKAISGIGIETKKPTDFPPVKRESLDSDARCMIMVSIALPGTLNAAKTNPSAAKGAQMLGRAQAFFTGRLLGTSKPNGFEADLVQAYIYSGQLLSAKDTQLLQQQATDCVGQYSVTLQDLMQAAASAAPPDKRG